MKALESRTTYRRGVAIPWANIDWGDFPTWISAVTTFGALVAAGWVVSIEVKRENRTEKLLDQQRADHARAEQADHVAAWYIRVESSRPGMPPGSQINVRNGSRLPIYDVAVELLEGPETHRLPRVAILPPGDHSLPYPDAMREITAIFDSNAKIRARLRALEIVLTFRDTAGRVWTRNQYGSLTQHGIAVPISTAYEMDSAPAVHASQDEPPSEDDHSPG